MRAKKVETFMTLAGQPVGKALHTGTPEQRKLGAQLLLSEVLEYVIVGLGIHPEVNGVKITDPEDVQYILSGKEPDKLEMLDGLADVAYTMYWNANAFGLQLEEAYELVCDNNLDKFVQLDNWQTGECALQPSEWGCNQDVTWPDEVVKVETVKVNGSYFAVGKDGRGKVRKPSSFTPVDLSELVANG
ncbi:hypothetical protein OAO01_01660 [Oligoflexia bacterium]|nr:hypothetical protein [Oligoflexia bacterium]